MLWRLKLLISAVKLNIWSLSIFFFYFAPYFFTFFFSLSNPSILIICVFINEWELTVKFWIQLFCYCLTLWDIWAFHPLIPQTITFICREEWCLQATHREKRLTVCLCDNKSKQASDLTYRLSFMWATISVSKTLRISKTSQDEVVPTKVIISSLVLCRAHTKTSVRPANHQTCNWQRQRGRQREGGKITQ